MNKQDYKEKMDQIFNDLEEGVRGVFTSENYVRYLETFSKFHNYSPSNTILILRQCPSATLVASYKDWKKNFGRVPKKGSHGIKVLVPTPKKIDLEEVEDDGTTTVTTTTKMYFKLGTVFDVSATVGKPLPSLAEELKDGSEEITALFEHALSSCDIPVDFDESLGADGANGYYDITNKQIRIKPTLSSLHKLKTLVHEYSHYLQETAYIETTKEFGRNEKEVIAESCAFCVLEMLSNEIGIEKLDSSSYSFGYIASWGSKDLKELKSTLDLIGTISRSIFKWVLPTESGGEQIYA